MHESLVRLNFERDMKHLTPRLAESRRWTINEQSCPVLDITVLGARPLRIRFDCADWDERPPAVSLFEVSGATLSNQGLGNIFNPSDHPSRPGPFICTPGFREYHTHPSHTGDLWDSYRGRDGMNLTGLLDQISRGWRKLGHG